jgi:SulP family sulfate permease
MNSLSLKNFRGDLFGGLTAAIIALPLAVAFGVASGVGPVAGLYGAVCVGLFAALFGGTPSQISGPTGPMTIVSATVFTQFSSQPAIAFTVVMMAGAFQVLFGYLKLGRYINLMPYPVISGFMTGIGCILIIMQIEPLLGHSSLPSVINALTVLPDDAMRPNWHAVAIGMVAFTICTLTPDRFARLVPPPLIALIVGSLMALVFARAPVLGSIPSSLPTFRMPGIDVTALNQMLISAAVLAALGSIDSLLTSLVADNVTRSFHDSDKELVGQGIGNLVAGFVGGLPGAGATIRTLANVNAGGRTCLSGVIHALVLLAIVLGLGPAVAHIPNAALAGILLKVGIDVIDWRFLKRMNRLPRVDMILMLVVLTLTVFVDVVTAVGVGIVLASLSFVKEVADEQVEAINAIVDPEHTKLFTADEAEIFRRCNGRTLVLHLAGLISFGAANEMTRRITIVERYEVLIIDLCDVSRIDGSAALALGEIIERAAEANQEVIMVGLNLPSVRLLSHIGVLDVVKETSRFSSRRDAILAAVQFLERFDAANKVDA